MDRTLVQAAQGGDRDAYAVLARTDGDRLYALAWRILRDPGLAEDAVQQALVIAWRELPGLRDPDRFSAWITRLLVHACYAESRRQTRFRALVRAAPAEGLPASDDTRRVVDRDEIERGLRRLPAEQRALLVLRHYVGLEPTEIAERLLIPAGTVRSRLHAAHRAMRAALEAEARSSAPAAGLALPVASTAGRP